MFDFEWGIDHLTTSAYDLGHYITHLHLELSSPASAINALSGAHA